MIKGVKQGIGFFLGLCISAAFAYTVSGTIKTWTSGDTLTATDLNTTVQSLKTAIENASQIGVAGYSLTNGTIRYSQLLSSSSTAAEIPTTMNRAGTVKNAVVKIDTNTGNAACTATLRKNSTDTAIQLIVSAGSTTTVTDADTVNYVAGDNLSWSYICPGLSSGIVYTLINFEF